MSVSRWYSAEIGFVSQRRLGAQSQWLNETQVWMHASWKGWGIWSPNDTASFFSIPFTLTQYYALLAICPGAYMSSLKQQNNKKVINLATLCFQGYNLIQFKVTWFSRKKKLAPFPTWELQHPEFTDQILKYSFNLKVMGGFSEVLSIIIPHLNFTLQFQVSDVSPVWELLKITLHWFKSYKQQLYGTDTTDVNQGCVTLSGLASAVQPRHISS